MLRHSCTSLLAATPVAAAKAGGAELTVHEMEDVGHAFPESEYPAVRQWLFGTALGRTP